MNFDNPFLTEQIIAYIGNKRKLLGLIYDALKETVPNLCPGMRFFDVFAGSGVVSRFAKSLNFEVYSNDWENYSYIINNGFIKTNLSDIKDLFGSEEDLTHYLEMINNLPNPSEEEQYIAKYYAPKSFDIDDVDFRVERLFYTRDNALQIDKVRNYIDKEHPQSDDNRVRNFLLSILLYQSATHTNTSGVFKAFHKGFGGHNRDAMKRILTPIRLSHPVLVDSNFPVHIFKEDANILVKSTEMQNIDIAYLDPPYNQHQYGSNYHMLNTIALWDKLPMPLTLNDKGVLKEKAAIRKDWIKTKSNYCYSESAISSFADLIENLSTRFILISYSSDGLIPFDVMKDICTRKGKVSIVTNEYTKYRGGKQSNNRLSTNIEFILIIETDKKTTPQSLVDIETVMNRKKVLLLFKQKYKHESLQNFSAFVDENCISINVGERLINISTIQNFELLPPEELNSLSLKESDVFLNTLNRCVCSTKEEELKEIVSKINGNVDNNLYFIKMIPDTLRKLAHKKNKDRFYFWIEEIKQIENSHPELYPLIKEKIVQIQEIAERRFAN